jgi:hypothetical protein
MKCNEKTLLSEGRTIRSQIVFHQNSKLEDSRLKNGEKIVDRQTDGQG